MRVTCRVAAAAVCALGLATVASAQQSVPGTKGASALAGGKPQTAWPKTPPLSNPSETPVEPSAGWSAEDIEAARARCSELLKGLDLVVIPHAPVREGSRMRRSGTRPARQHRQQSANLLLAAAAAHLRHGRGPAPLAAARGAAARAQAPRVADRQHCHHELLLMPICPRHGPPERARARQCHRHRRVPDGRGRDCRGARRLGADRARGRRQGHCGEGRRRQEGRREKQVAKVRGKRPRRRPRCRAYSSPPPSPASPPSFRRHRRRAAIGVSPSAWAPPSRLGGPKPADFAVLRCPERQIGRSCAPRTGLPARSLRPCSAPRPTRRTRIISTSTCPSARTGTFASDCVAGLIALEAPTHPRLGTAGSAPAVKHP